jgi:hypothetical protein
VYKKRSCILLSLLQRINESNSMKLFKIGIAFLFGGLVVSMPVAAADPILPPHAVEHAETGVGEHVASPDVAVPTHGATDTGESWMSLQDFLGDDPAMPRKIEKTPTSSSKVLSSLNLTDHAAVKPPVEKFIPVQLAPLPPLFERPKTSPQVVEKTKKVQPVTLKQDIEVVPPVPPVAPAKCAVPELQKPELSKQAKNYASDTATLDALQRAVQDLGLRDKMDFLMPQNIRAPSAVISKVKPVGQ